MDAMGVGMRRGSELRAQHVVSLVLRWPAFDYEAGATAALQSASVCAMLAASWASFATAAGGNPIEQSGRDTSVVCARAGTAPVISAALDISPTANNRCNAGLTSQGFIMNGFLSWPVAYISSAIPGWKGLANPIAVICAKPRPHKS